MTIIDNFNFVQTDVECPESTQAKMFASPQFMDFIVQYDSKVFINSTDPTWWCQLTLSITVFTNLPNKSSSPRDIAAQQHIAWITSAKKHTPTLVCIPKVVKQILADKIGSLDHNYLDYSIKFEPNCLMQDKISVHVQNAKYASGIHNHWRAHHNNT
jgi:hypothetical protein